LREGEVYRCAAGSGDIPEWIEYLKQQTIAPGRGTAAARAVLEGRTIHIPDVLADPEYTFLEAQRRGGFRTALGVPLLREGTPIGAMVLTRPTVRPFDANHIALVNTFADQAVIAIENVRLFEAEQERSRELGESLQQQTATADVLKIISRSTFDLKIVLNTLVESATRVCEAELGNIARPRDENTFFVEATYGMSPEFVADVDRRPLRIGRGTAIGRALLERKTVQIIDAQADPDYELIDLRKQEGLRTLLGVPLIRDGVPIGVFALGRRSVRPFTEKQIELVTTFADQAVIAIENVRLFDEIQNKSRQLEEASQHKSQFLANMSHELRTPLNAILGYTELMADGAYGEPSEKMVGILQRLEANGKHLLGLINDVLDLSKIEAGQLVLELSDYTVQDIAQTVRSTLEPLAADKKLAFKVEVAPQMPSGRGDGRRLTQVLINLVGNAIKFTDAGEVVIKAEANNGAFYVSVRDTGPGISAADQTRLFQEFQQADNAITRKKGGTGLGLAISKRIIEMHGGRIWVESQPGQGSTFTFTLPVIVERQVEAA
jgi:signal transduction histidine kinase